MIMRIPAHKNTLNPPGQITNESLPNRTPKKLGDIIDDVKRHEEYLMKEKKKLTFNEWWKNNMQNYPEYMGLFYRVLKAAQQNL
jgi:hypothetical protein